MHDVDNLFASQLNTVQLFATHYNAIIDEKVVVGLVGEAGQQLLVGADLSLCRDSKPPIANCNVNVVRI